MLSNYRYNGWILFICWNANQEIQKKKKLVRTWTPGKEKEKRATPSTPSTPSETKLRTVLKLPGGAFSHSNTLRGTDDQQRQQSHTEPKVKAIRLKAVDKHPKKKGELYTLFHYPLLIG